MSRHGEVRDTGGAEEPYVKYINIFLQGQQGLKLCHPARCGEETAAL